MSARILVIDIETAPNLAYVFDLWKQDIGLSQIAQVGQVISFAAKWHGSKQIEFYSDYHDGHEVMVRRAHELINEADIVVHWNGTSFDIPWLNREFLLLGLEPPSPHKDVDLYLAVKRKFRFASNKLDHVAQMLGVGGKVKHAGFELWLKCMAADEAAWKVMRRYNKRDVQITEKVYDRVLPWLNHPHIGLYSDAAKGCGRCGGSLQRRGYAYTALGKFQRFQCTGCGGWSRGGKRLDGVDARPA